MVTCTKKEASLLSNSVMIRFLTFFARAACVPSPCHVGKLNKAIVYHPTFSQ